MRIAVLGTGMVGRTLGAKLVELGHDVRLGSRSADNAKAGEWVKSIGRAASQGTFADAASFGEIVFNCTAGGASLDALNLAGAPHLQGKTLVDVANPLDFSHGMPPTLSICNTESLGERIQTAFPAANVVKTLNTVNANVMVNPSLVPGDHDVFISGNEAVAKAQVIAILKDFGWRHIVDLGDITTARGPEMWLPMWLRLWGAFKTPNINIHVTHA